MKVPRGQRLQRDKNVLSRLLGSVYIPASHTLHVAFSAGFGLSQAKLTNVPAAQVVVVRQSAGESCHAAAGAPRLGPEPLPSGIPAAQGIGFPAGHVLLAWQAAGFHLPSHCWDGPIPLYVTYQLLHFPAGHLVQALLE